MPTCALCGGRDATTETDIDGRTYPCCAGCSDDAPELPPGLPPIDTMPLSVRAVNIARICPGLTAEEITEHLVGEDYERHNAIELALSRAVRDGYLVRQHARYERTKKPWRAVHA